MLHCVNARRLLSGGEIEHDIIDHPYITSHCADQTKIFFMSVRAWFECNPHCLALSEASSTNAGGYWGCGETGWPPLPAKAMLCRPMRCHITYATTAIGWQAKTGLRAAAAVHSRVWRPVALCCWAVHCRCCNLCTAAASLLPPTPVATPCCVCCHGQPLQGDSSWQQTHGP